MAQDEPFDQFPRCRVADRFLYRSCFAGLGLAREIDGILYGREIAGERRGVATRSWNVAGSRRFALQRRDMPSFLKLRMAVMPYCGHVMRRDGLMSPSAGPCHDVGRTNGEHRQAQQTT
jgi:hypothetical protein